MQRQAATALSIDTLFRSARRNNVPKTTFTLLFSGALHRTTRVVSVYVYLSQVLPSVFVLLAAGKINSIIVVPHPVCSTIWFAV